MLATIVYSVNPKTSVKKDGFVAFSSTPEKALKRKEVFEYGIKSGAYKHWRGAGRIHFVENALKNGYKLVVSNIMISDN